MKLRPEKFLACISSNEKAAKVVIRKTARLASYYHSTWIVLYVQNNNETAENIKLDKQRYLLHNFKLATELGAEVIRLKSDEITDTIIRIAEEKEVTTICIGKPHFSWLQLFLGKNVLNC